MDGGEGGGRDPNQRRGGGGGGRGGGRREDRGGGGGGRGGGRREDREGGGGGGEGGGRGGGRNVRAWRGDGNQERVPRHWKTRLGFKKLTELKENEASDILIAIAHSTSGLQEGLNDGTLSNDFIGLFLRCIAKACECHSAPAKIIQLLTLLHNSTFINTTLPTFIMRMNFEHSPIRQKELKVPLGDIICIISEIARRSPSSITSVYGVIGVLEQVMNTLRATTDVIDDELWDRFEDCCVLKEQMLEEVQRRSMKREETNVRHDDEEPPNNFREISVFPGKSDIQNDEGPFLRRNKVEGGFRDLGHYLDVQFRLLREDFVGPLRDGINEYIAAVQTGRSKRSHDMRIYYDVQVLCPIGTNNGLCHRICFDVSRMQRVNWESSKRLIFGSLVCISKDNFKTLMFATVADRDAKKLKDGILDIKFEDFSRTQFSLDFNKRYVMAETVAYFEAYRHVLKGLQNVNDGDLPFEKYIVECNTRMKPPFYLVQNPDAKFDLRPLVDDNCILRGVKAVDGLHCLTHEFSERAAAAKSVEPQGTWPSSELLHLDESQYEAVKRSLTSEFVLTQGPPGTGKTYIGLKIVKALLHNYSLWNTNPETNEIDHRPMLIVCYTNHALDQFLEGIYSYFKGSILRVGGRSSSEAMKQFNLHNMRARMRELREVPGEIHRGRMDARNNMKDLQDEINKISGALEIASREVLNEEVLESFMGRFYADLIGAGGMINYFEDGFRTQKRNKHSIILDWLCISELVNADEEPNDDRRRGDVPNQAAAQAGIPNQADGHVGAQHQAAVPNPVVGGNNNEGVDDGEEVEELVDVLDEIDALIAQREIGEDFDDEYDTDMEKAELVMLKMRLNKQSVALDVTNLEEKDDKRAGGWQMTRKQKKQLKKHLRRELASSNCMAEEEIDTIYDIWQMIPTDRWRLYRYWVHKFSEMMRDKIRGKVGEYQAVCDQYKEILMHEDKGVMKRATVVGMTTTGAAKYQAVLQEIGPRVIVVEEAAEVLEAHVVTTLSRHCQHLILIGDHKQLRPNPTVYKLAKDYHLDLSLFERMIKNGIEPDCLGLQHRMRPEISRILTLIYPELKDHNIVTTYGSVKGISTNAFFINHNFPEQEDDDLKSHSNIHEATYIAGLCKYLLLQGYKPDQITILTLYSGQLFTIRREMPKHTFEGVRITVVDNFQGEENDIILLSLVRSNSEGKIGFLKIDNRVCVALSRAKMGLFVVGNMDMMTQGSKLWKNIGIHAKKEKMIGEELRLFCQNHPDDIGTCIRIAEDFRKVPEGGCMKPCEFRLDCGHTCSMVCHILDEKHEQFECRKKCERKLCMNGHRCKKLCYQKCGDCHVPMQKEIPKCGHIQTVPCHMDPVFFCCKAKCTEMLSCEHQCAETCGELHTQNCEEPVMKSWWCGHRGMVRCFEKNTKQCVERCMDSLACEHPCTGSCSSCVMGRLHKACTSRCERTLICGHICQDRCSRCPPCQRPCENRCIHSKCQNGCGEPCVSCMEKCEWECKHHSCLKLCSEPCERPRCDRPCTKKLKCKHKCIGMCGEKCPSLCRICDRDIVTEIFFGDEDEPDARFIQLEDCGHVIEVNAMDTYMDQSPADDENEILFKVCPRCKTSIRRNLRYGNQIKQTLINIEQVKRKLLGDEHRIKQLMDNIQDKILDLDAPDAARVRERYESVLDEKHITRDKRNNMTSLGKLWEESMVTIENQATFIRRIADLRRKYRDSLTAVSLALRDGSERAKEDIEKLRLWVLRPRTYFTTQETADVADEICRLEKLRHFFLYKQKIQSLNIELEDEVKRRVRVAECMLTDGRKFTEANQKKVTRTLEILKGIVPKSGLGITEEERVQITQAMGMGAGHWFKCPNGDIMTGATYGAGDAHASGTPDLAFDFCEGHVYAIGDCGGAQEEGRCPECKTTIGGISYRLHGGNTFAPEMDNAQAPAWPTMLP